MKKHLIIWVIALAMMASAPAAMATNDRGHADGGVPLGSGGAGGGRGAELPNSTEGMAKLGDALDLLHDIVERAEKESRAAEARAARQRELEHPAHNDGHQGQPTGVGDDRPQSTNDPQRTIDARGEAHDAHEVHEVHVHEPEVHEHEAPAREPREGNAGKKN